MRRKESKRRRNNSNSEESCQTPEDCNAEDLYRSLKQTLVANERPQIAHHLLEKLQKHFRHSVGILRISLPSSFTFSEKDIEDFFRRYGNIERIVLKSKRFDEYKQDQLQTQSIAYVIFSQHCSALLALKVLNSLSEKERMITAKVCQMAETSADTPLFSEPLIDRNRLSELIIEVEKDYQFGEVTKPYKYVGTIGIDISDHEFKMKERILGVDGCNIFRVHYICEKMFQFEHENEVSKAEDLVIKLVSNKGVTRDVLVLSHSLFKYNQAVRCLHQLLEQIVEEYKNSKEKLAQIIPRDVHVRKWEKFTIDTQLKFLT